LLRRSTGSAGVSPANSPDALAFHRSSCILKSQIGNHKYESGRSMKSLLLFVLCLGIFVPRCLAAQEEPESPATICFLRKLTKPRARERFGWLRRGERSGQQSGSRRTALPKSCQLTASGKNMKRSGPRFSQRQSRPRTEKSENLNSDIVPANFRLTRNAEKTRHL